MIQQNHREELLVLGKELLRLQGDVRNLEVREKGSNGPVTKADLYADAWLKEFLPKILNVPVFSEEDHPFENSQDSFWLIDPIDGTKEFVAGGTDFCVCAVLFQGIDPTFSFIYSPAHSEIYWAKKGEGAFRWKENTAEKNQENSVVQIFSNARRLTQLKEATLLVSKSHPSKKVTDFVDRLEIQNRVPMGSALKFCRIAEGNGDLNFRFSTTWDWDLAPGYLIVKESGGDVLPLMADALEFCDSSRKVGPFAAVSGSAKQLFQTRWAEIQSDY